MWLQLRGVLKQAFRLIFRLYDCSLNLPCLPFSSSSTCFLYAASFSSIRTRLNKTHKIWSFSLSIIHWNSRFCASFWKLVFLSALSISISSHRHNPQILFIAGYIIYYSIYIYIYIYTIRKNNIYYLYPFAAWNARIHRRLKIYFLFLSLKCGFLESFEHFHESSFKGFIV